MKRILLLVAVLLTFFACHAQESRRPFEDALAISRSLAKPGNKDYVEVLKKYAATQNIQAFVDGNIFLAAHSGLVAANKAEGLAPANIKSIQSSTGGFSFIPEHEAIDALGSFIAKRFKEELNIAFINKFRDKLKAQVDLQAMMPTTYKFLLENEPYNYTSFLESLRAAFKQDLENLPANFTKLTRLNRNQIVDTLKFDGYAGLLMGLEAVNSFLKKNSSAQILLDMTGIAEADTINNAQFRFSVKLLNATVSELTDKVTRDWYGDVAMKDVFGSGSEQNSLLFLGLFYEKHKSLFADEAITKKLPAYMEQVTKTYTIIRNYQAEIKLIKTTTGNVTVSDALRYLDLTINAADELLNIDDVFGSSFANSLVKNNVISHARRSLAIISDIDKKEYATAFVNTVSLAADLLPKKTTFRKEFVRYGNFAVSIVTAENSDAMVVALESAALPVGSYQVKRESICNISLNAFAGGFLGMEYVKERGGVELPEDVETTAGVAGFSAPIGVAFSFGSRRDYNKANDSDKRTFGPKGKEKVLTGCSWSLFISALDLGAVTAFRLQNDKAETLPEMTFQNVLAPGAYLIHGFKGVPVSLGVGAQYGPQVRKIADLGSEQELLSLWSARVLIAVDIPLFNLYTRNEK
jgi:hypothetical protein